MLKKIIFLAVLAFSVSGAMASDPPVPPCLPAGCPA